MASNEINSQAVNSAELSPTQEITDVYIGVFFDGTANNMLWTAKEKIKNYRDKLKKTYGIENGLEQFGQKVSNVIKIQDGISKDVISKIIKFDLHDHNDVEKLSEEEIDTIINSHIEEYETYIDGIKDTPEKRKEFIKRKIEKIDEETSKADRIVDDHTTLKDEDEWGDFVKLQLSKEDKCRALKKGNYHSNCKDCKIKSHECNLLNKTDAINIWIIKNYKDNKYFWGKDAIRQYKNAHTTYQPTMCGGFSNIAILYSAYNPEPHNKQSKQYKIYIEGSGATDISEKNFLIPELLEKMNINGLGFGLGKTGVVALVSKAVYYVNNFIESIKSQFPKGGKVNIHFNVFGFSRGATCSRLFSYLVTRGDADNMGIREKEFADFYAKRLYYKKKGGNDNAKLHFLEDTIYNKTVDFLGIYDTVVSIGFLLQKDGYVNPLAWSYKNNAVDWIADNYKGNWHCNNVSEYGMYSTSSEYTHKDKIKNILHICAMDEFRENFASTNVGETVGSNAVEIYIPGCHSDIGGGYYDGDEEQEILLKKKVKKGSAIKDEEWNYRRQSDLLHTRMDKLFHPIRIKMENEKDKKGFWDIIDDIDNVKIYRTREDVEDKIVHFNKDSVSNNNSEKKYSPILLDLFNLGWLDENWDNSDITRKKITLNGDIVPCTRRITDGPWYVKFKRNVKAGYSNIPLSMMIQYADSKITSQAPIPSIQFIKLFDINYINEEYPVPSDLNSMSTKMIEIIKDTETKKRLWLYPKDDDYKKLRMKYLHFTSTYRLYHASKPENGVKWKEGSFGNIANTPNQDLEGRICRIVYNGDKGDYNINYMYNDDVKKEDVIISPCSVDFVLEKIGDFPPKNPSIC